MSGESKLESEDGFASCRWLGSRCRRVIIGLIAVAVATCGVSTVSRLLTVQWSRIKYCCCYFDGSLMWLSVLSQSCFCWFSFVVVNANVIQSHHYTYSYSYYFYYYYYCHCYHYQRQCFIPLIPVLSLFFLLSPMQLFPTPSLIRCSYSVSFLPSSFRIIHNFCFTSFINFPRRAPDDDYITNIQKSFESKYRGERHLILWSLRTSESVRRSSLEWS